MLGWCEAIARNPRRIPNNTRTPEGSEEWADASQTSTLVSAAVVPPMACVNGCGGNGEGAGEGFLNSSLLCNVLYCSYRRHLING